MALTFNPFTGKLDFTGSQANAAIGSTGATGPSGGPTGATGATGNAGATGLQGDVGATGVIGATGLEGATGLTGATGDVGATGLEGATGLDGSTGATGLTPLICTPFLSGDYYFQAVGTTYNGLSYSNMAWGAGQTLSVYAPDEGGIIQHMLINAYDPITGNITATITYSQNPGYKTQAGVTLCLIGQTGATGATGSDGATGVTGATGEVGATGLEGATGLQGSTGATGATGDVGATGLEGATGLTGATGEIGSTGIQGATGDAGATGLQGNDGPTPWTLPATVYNNGASYNLGAAVTYLGGYYYRTGNPLNPGYPPEPGVINASWTPVADGGATGLQGDAGATGLTGATGLGATGATGLTGATGPATGAAGGDLSGSYPNPSVVKLQGNAVSSSAPSSGQTLQWNGSEWVPGAIPNGGSGGGGLVYFFNYQNTTGISPTTGLPTSPVAVSQLGRNYDIGSGSITSGNLTNGSYSLVCGFVTIATEPNVTTIPAGLWDFNIWADVSSVSGNQTQFQIRVFKYNSTTGVYTSLANSDDIYIYDPATITQYIGNVTMPQTTILATDRIYIELWAQKNVSGTRTISFYFDSLHPSHCHTTLPSVTGDGVVKVVNGVFQSPASTIVNADVSSSAAIVVSKLSQATSKILGRTTSGTGSVEELSVAGNLTLSTGTLTATTTDVQIFTSSGTWTKPANAKSVNIQLFGGGGGGGGGRKDTTAITTKSGGGGGGGGGYLNITIPAAALLASESVTIGAGGTAGNGSGSTGGGGNGGSGGTTIFKSLLCLGGTGGSGGTRTLGNAGNGILNAHDAGSSSISQNANNGFPPTTNSQTQFGGCGGGGGGGISVASDPFIGGNGGRSNVLNYSGGAGGAATGVAGSVGTSNTSASSGLFAVGSGGGGGGAGLAVSGGVGGAGGFPAGGGGGGGATETGTTSGAGGVGGAGIAIITTYF